MVSFWARLLNTANVICGFALVVSHDRWFLDRIWTHLIVFEGDSIAKMYIGNWSDYEEMMDDGEVWQGLTAAPREVSTVEEINNSGIYQLADDYSDSLLSESRIIEVTVTLKGLSLFYCPRLFGHCIISLQNIYLF
jgi:hypothetical protein